MPSENQPPLVQPCTGWASCRPPAHGHPGISAGKGTATGNTAGDANGTIAAGRRQPQSPATTRRVSTALVRASIAVRPTTDKYLMLFIRNLLIRSRKSQYRAQHPHSSIPPNSDAAGKFALNFINLWEISRLKFDGQTVLESWSHKSSFRLRDFLRLPQTATAEYPINRGCRGRCNC